MNRILFIISLFLISKFSFGQEKEQFIQFRFTFNKEEVKLNQNYYLASIKDSVQFETLKFYFGNFIFTSKKNLSDTLAKKYHLVDWEDESTRKLLLENINSEGKSELSFSLGVDSLTNVGGAMGGDLDPTNGMYWAWQSGYINFKIEGKSNVCDTRNHVFQFHIGGYQNPNATYQAKEVDLEKKKSIIIEIPLDEILSQINLVEENEIMSPGTRAVQISKIVVESIQLKE